MDTMIKISPYFNKTNLNHSKIYDLKKIEENLKLFLTNTIFKKIININKLSIIIRQST